MAAILFVRVISHLDEKELERRLIERRPRFREVHGLVQKIYGRDDETGDVCGIYFFEDKEALVKFRETELAKTIPAAYEAKDIRREVFDVLYQLHPERGRLQNLKIVNHPERGMWLHILGVRHKAYQCVTPGAQVKQQGIFPYSVPRVRFRRPGRLAADPGIHRPPN